MSGNPHAALVTAVADVVSAAAIVGTFLGWLPPLAAAAAIVWYVIQVWESKTVQKWYRLRRRHKRRVRVRAAEAARHRHPRHRVRDH